MQSLSARRASHGEIRCGVLPSTVTLRIREPGSALTHLIAFIGVLAGAGPLLMRARLFGSVRTVLTMAVFLASAALLYAASTVYHTVVLDENRTRVFKKIDHMSISVLIAGTYTPVCLLVLEGRTGLILLAAVWTLAAGGILLKALWVTCPKWVSSVLYLAMGWVCVFAMGPLLTLLPSGAFFWLLLGGLFYSAGAVIYALRRKAFDEAHPYFGTHEIFHLFIMGGTLCHYVFMYAWLSLLP